MTNNIKNIIKIKEFANMLNTKMEEVGKEEFMNDLLNFSETTLTLEDGVMYTFLKSAERIISKAQKQVETEYIVFSLNMDEKDFEIVAVVSVTSTANKLSGKKVKFSSPKNLVVKLPDRNISVKFAIAFQYRIKFKEYNNLLSFCMNIRDDNGKLLEKDITYDEFFNKHATTVFTGISIPI